MTCENCAKEASARASAEKDAANYQRLMLNLVADNDVASFVLADIAKVIGVFNIRGGWYRPEEFAALVAMHVAEITRQREDSDRRVRLAVKALMRATGRTQEEIEAAPMGIAIEHAAESSLLAQKTREAADTLEDIEGTASAALGSCQLNESAWNKVEAIKRMAISAHSALRALPSAPPAGLCRLCLLPKDWGRIHEVGAWGDSHEFRSDAALNPPAPPAESWLHKMARAEEEAGCINLGDPTQAIPLESLAAPPATPETEEPK